MGLIVVDANDRSATHQYPYILASRSRKEPQQQSGAGQGENQMRNTLGSKLMKFTLSGALLAGGLALAQEDTTPPAEEAPIEATDSSGNLVATLRADADYSVFVRMLESSGLMATLNDGNTYTIFAPTNEALNSLDIDFDEAGSGLDTFVRSHIFVGHFTPEDLMELDGVMAMSGGEADVGSSADALTVGDLRIDSAAWVTDNGVIYQLDEAFPSAVAALRASVPAQPAAPDDNGSDDTQ